MTQSAELQPGLHHLVGCVHAPSATLSDAYGKVTGVGAEGFYLGERRLLRTFLFSALGRDPEVLNSKLGSDGVLRIIAVVRDGTEDTPDPNLVLRLCRQQHGTGFVDTISIHNVGMSPRTVPMVLMVAADLAPMSTLKGGHPSPDLLVPHPVTGGIGFAADGYSVEITSSSPATADLANSAMRWDITIPAAGTWNTTLAVTATQPIDGAFRPVPAAGPAWNQPTITTTHASLTQLVEWSFGDLRRLALADPLAPADVFIAAGCPWYFTLFGRDSLWTARMMMPFGTDLAASTLRALARRQGTRHDPAAAEEPGRIPHEIRPAITHEGPMSLPPVYYGSVDATPLWITTLAEAWRWGLADEQVRPLLDALRAAVDWLVELSDPDGDGLCEYVDRTGTGLSNQGWKDSGDSISWHDGTLATAPIALVEVQAYAYEAAMNAIQMYEHFGLAGSDAILAFALRLKQAFHASFWLDDDRGPRLAVALDAAKRAVDSTTSNPGHVLGTGLLTSEQEATVVAQLVAELDCGVGMRTMSIRDGRYNPVSYHNGSIWPHDTAICARGMILAGHPRAAATLLNGLLTATTAFHGRLPELFGSIDDSAPIVAYPASCRPQAWAAAVGPVVLWAAAPLVPGLPGQPPVPLTGIDLFDDLDVESFTFRGQRVHANVCQAVVTFGNLDG